MTLTEQIKAVRREIDYRKRLYPKWVEDGKLEQKEADYQIEVMEQVLSTLNALLEFHRSFITKNEKLFR